MAVQRKNNERLTRRVIVGATAGGEDPGPGRSEKRWAQSRADDLNVFRATHGSKESSISLSALDTVLRPTAANIGGKWYRGVVEAADCFTARWYRGEAERSWLPHAAGDGGRQGWQKGKGGSRSNTAVEGSKRNGRSCGTGLIRLTSGTYAIDAPTSGIVRFVMFCTTTQPRRTPVLLFH